MHACVACGWSSGWRCEKNGRHLHIEIHGTLSQPGEKKVVKLRLVDLLIYHWHAPSQPTTPSTRVPVIISCLSIILKIYEKKVLEGTPEGESAAKYLRKSFAAMVAMQVEAASAAAGRPRFVNRKARTANRRSTPKKNC